MGKVVPPGPNFFFWLHPKKGYSRIPAKISFRTFGNPKMVFEGKKRFPSIPESLWEFQIVTNSETEKSFRSWKNLFKRFRVSRTLFGFGVCYYLKLSEGFRNARKPFFCPRKPFLGFRTFGNLFWPVFENTFFLDCRTVTKIFSEGTGTGTKFFFSPGPGPKMIGTAHV
jgi:hypothetical protein